MALRGSHGAVARLGTRVVGLMLFAYDRPGLAEAYLAERRVKPNWHSRPKVAELWMPYYRFTDQPHAAKLHRAKREDAIDAALHWYTSTDDRELHNFFFASGDALLILYFYGEPPIPATIWAVARDVLDRERVPMPTD